MQVMRGGTYYKVKNILCLYYRNRIVIFSVGERRSREVNYEVINRKA